MTLVGQAGTLAGDAAELAEADGASAGDSAAVDGDAGEQAVGGPAAGAQHDSSGASEQILAPDQASLGLFLGRLRNDALPIAARYVLIPGALAFNDRVLGIVREAISDSASPYVPQVFPAGAGLGDRGCFAGSTRWPASEVLTRPETGPAGGVGTAVTCEVLSAFGPLLGVSVRVVVGSADAVSSDRSTVLYANLSTGEVLEGVNAWSDEAPSELWTKAVELLRREAGALSRAAVAEPDDAQRALAAEALASGHRLADGGAEFPLRAGIAAPELAGLGIAATASPIVVRADAATVLSWSSEQQRQLLAASTEPFVGITTPATSVPVDCALVPCVAVTYDDGPSGYTPALLDTLRDERASATFFLIGNAAAGAPGVVQRIAAEGHELGSHTMNHPDLSKLPVADAKKQVLEAAAVIGETSGQPITMFRPPYGAITSAVIAEVGLPAILWSVDTNDWREPGQATVAQRAVEGAAPGGIVLMHDTHADTVAAAGAVIRGLRDRGFEPVTVSELFGGAVPSGRVFRR